MTRDPSVVGRARVGAQTLGEVMDSFVESISWKTWVCAPFYSLGAQRSTIDDLGIVFQLFSISSLAFVTAFVNGCVNLYRSRLLSSSNPEPHNPSHMPHMPVPGFTAPYGYLPLNMGQHPYENQHQKMGWHPETDSEGVPKQRRRLENGDAPVTKDI